MSDGVIIRIKGDDSEYKKTLNGVERTAKSAAATLAHEYAKAGMSLQESMAKAWSEVKSAQKNGTTVVINGVETIISKNEKLISQKKDMSDIYNGVAEGAAQASKTLRVGLADIKAGIDLATGAMQKFADVAGKGINYNAQIERLTTSFEVMTGSAEKAAEMVERLRIMGAETPFEMTDLAGTVQMLMQYGFAADEAIDRMSMLGDIAQGNRDAMTSIALGYAQMSSAGKANLVDIKQMINGGFNPLQEISERTGESMASLYERISKGTLSVDEITESMRYATSEGGKFFQSMEKQSQTLSGQLSTLKDNADQLLGSLTEGLSDELRSEILPLANEMIGDLQGAFAEGGVQGLIDNATAMIPDLLNMMSGEVQGAIAGLSKWLPKGATALMKAVPGAIRSASGVLPQITTALFEVSSLIVGDLVAMLPELVPVVLTGIGDMAFSILRGAGSILTELFSGIEQMFHQGQTKVAGIWVDDAEIAKFDYKIDMSIDTKTAENEVTQAYNSIRDALNTDLLTDDQRDEILGMIGEDYQTIYDKLISFGVSTRDAQALAGKITASAGVITDELGKLDIGVDGATLFKWGLQANGSRIALKEKLRAQGLDDDEIAEVVGVFDTMHGRIKDATPNIAEEIYAELTDGLSDDPTALKAKVKSYIEAQDTAIDEAYNEAVSKLDPADGDYAEKLATLNDDYAAAKADLQTIGADLNTLIDTLAGASTATVQSKYQLLADVETQVNGLSKRIDELAGKAAEAGLTAYNVVRSGARADEATISQAISYKVSEFRIDEQSAEDAYNAAVAELNEKFSSGRISKEVHDAGIESAETTHDAEIAAAKQAYENALAQIFSGIAEGEGIDDVLASGAAKANLANSINEFVESGFGASLDAQEQESITQELLNKVKNILGIDAESQFNSYVVIGDMPGLTNLLNAWSSMLITDAETALESVDNTKLSAAYKSALEKGILEGTSFDTSESTSQLTALLNFISSTATDAAAPDMKTDGYSAGMQLDAGVAQGISDGESMVVDAAENVARAAAGAMNRVFEIRSPSRVGRGIGSNFGGSVALGIQDSIANAVRVAKMLSGQIVTAADFPRTTNVNYTGLQQEIIAANEQTATPVYLDGRQIAEIQGLNNSTQIAWQNTRTAKGVGSK